MPKANEVAKELRKLADCLDREPETMIHRPLIHMSSDNKEEFLAIARLMPKPMTKRYTDWCGVPSIEINYETEALRIWDNANRNKVCRMVRPAMAAEFECEPLLSAGEESAIEAA